MASRLLHSDLTPRDGRPHRGHAYIPTPILTGAAWRLLGDVVFIAIDRGGGLIQMVVANGVPYAIDATLSWSWGGVTGKSEREIPYNQGATLEVQLPPGFDATLEILARL
jgi:hypothetical protein